MWDIFIDVILEDFVFCAGVGSIEVVYRNCTNETSTTSQWKMHTYTYMCVCVYFLTPFYFRVCFPTIAKVQ